MSQGDRLRFVKPGERFKPSAGAWNAFVGVAKAFKRDKELNGTNESVYPSDYSSIQIRNDTGADLPRFGVAAIDVPIFPPTSDTQPPEFFNEFQLSVVSPEAINFDAFVITTEPIRDGGIGWAIICGAVPVKLDVVNEDHWYARITPSDTSKLTSSIIGSASIVWKQSGTGTKWAIVKLGDAGPKYFRAKLTTYSGSGGDDTADCDFHYDIVDPSDNTTVLASDVDPVADGKHKRLALTTYQEADFAWCEWIWSGESFYPMILSCNEIPADPEECG